MYLWWLTYSRYFYVVAMTSITSEKMIRALGDRFAVHEFLLELKNDDGPQSVLELFKCYPNANREVARHKKTLLESTRTANLKLNKLLFTYSRTLQSATGVNPDELLFGKKFPQLEDPSVGAVIKALRCKRPSCTFESGLCLCLCDVSLMSRRSTICLSCNKSS